MTTLIEHIGQRIREFRTNYGEGSGISQDALAQALGVATNTISRWETATYEPRIEDLEKLARFFGKSVLDFLPLNDIRTERDEKIDALLRTAKQLDDKEVEALKNYAEYRRARQFLEKRSGKRKSKK